MKIQSLKPSHLNDHSFEMTWNFSSENCKIAWDKLQLRETFTKGQIPHYKVEFESLSQVGPFQTEELNIHHGPFLSVHGAIGEITENYRDLIYYYGSYVISFRLIRPIRLEFFKTEKTIKVRLTSYVHPLFEIFWDKGLLFFWKIFGVTF